MPEIYGDFLYDCNSVFFFCRKTPNKNFLDVINKETNKVMWHYCLSLSIMDLELLIFNRKGWQLVLALLASIRLCYVCVKFKRTNQSFSTSKTSHSINVEWHTCERNGTQFFQWKQEKIWLFVKVRNVLIEKKIGIGQFLLDFAEYLRSAKEQQSS